MALRRICISEPRRGFTLVEICVVLAMLAIVASLGLSINLNGWRGSIFRDDCGAAAASLQRARSMAINNLCLGMSCVDGKTHGVFFDPAKKAMVIFQGDIFSAADPQNEMIEFKNTGTYIDATSPIDIIFQPLTANAAPAVVILRDASGHSCAISVSSNGRVDWQ